MIVECGVFSIVARKISQLFGRIEPRHSDSGALLRPLRYGVVGDEVDVNSGYGRSCYAITNFILIR